MTSRVITIRLEVPEGVEVRFDAELPDDDPDDLLPRPRWVRPSTREPVFPVIATELAGSGAGCPVHRLPWRTVPAGVSKRTGRPYQSFVACPEAGCDERPALGRRTAS